MRYKIPMGMLLQSQEDEERTTLIGLKRRRTGGRECEKNDRGTEGDE